MATLREYRAHVETVPLPHAGDCASCTLERARQRQAARDKTRRAREYDALIGCYSPVDGYRDMSDCWIADPREGNAHAALIESLSVFTREV